jgi:hypothetical protein
MLYLSTGDGVFDDPVLNPAQDLSSLAGKILRIDVDAPAPYIPLDNPFVGTPGARPEIWAYGLRNPWRFHIDIIVLAVATLLLGATPVQTLLVAAAVGALVRKR